MNFMIGINGRQIVIISLMITKEVSMEALMTKNRDLIFFSFDSNSNLYYISLKALNK